MNLLCPTCLKINITIPTPSTYLVWLLQYNLALNKGSSKRFNLKVQHTIIFTIGFMNLKTFQRTPIFFQVCGIDCSKQIESSHIMEENAWNDKSVGLIVDPHKPKGPSLGPTPNLISFRCSPNSLTLLQNAS